MTEGLKISERSCKDRMIFRVAKICPTYFEKLILEMQHQDINPAIASSYKDFQDAIPP